MDEMLSYKDYLNLLEKWVVSAKKYLYIPPERPDLICYGTGYSDNWSVQTHLKAFAVFAVLFSIPELDKNKIGMSSEELREISLKMLRFSLESHIEGNYYCFDGKKWGHTWISVLGLERAMHGIDAIKDYLTDSDKILLRKVMISESDWLVDDYYRSCPEEKGKIQAGLVKNNDPESNIWNGAFLLRTSFMYPDAPRVNEYVNKGIAFLINGISISSDAVSNEIVNGKPVSEWYIGSNFFDTFALNHHGYLNVGYMVICLSNIAILHFSYKLAGLTCPDFVYRHVKELWNVLKLFIFPDGRLCRIGGDTRIRYCYCQDYIIPVLLLILDLYGDEDCEKFEKGWLEILRKEFLYNEDGSFLSKRLKCLSEVSPLYYTRLESDRAVTLSMGAYWRRFLKIGSGAIKKKKEKYYQKSWYDEYHGVCFNRGKNRIVSFCWLSAQPPQGLCVPLNKSDMAEWRWNCSGMAIGLGRLNYHKILNHKEFVFEGGFITWGSTEIWSDGFLAEGQKAEIIGKHDLVFTALPDDATVLIMQKCVAPNRIFLKEIKGLLYNVPNDIFNDNVRNYYSEKINYKLEGNKSKEEIIDIYSRWLNIDNVLSIIGVYGSDYFNIYRPGRRQIGLMLSQYEGKVIETGLWVDEICYPYKKGVFSVNPNTVLFDIGCVIITGLSAKDTAKYVEKNVYVPEITPFFEDIRIIMVKGMDNKWYLQVANFSEKELSFTISLKNIKNANSLTMNTDFSLKPFGINLLMKNKHVEIFVLDF